VYQLEIVELAKNSNIVAYLDTGSGKTFIAVCLLRHRLDAYRVAWEKGPSPDLTANSRGTTRKRWMAAFLAPQVALVEQQAAVLARHLPVRVGKFTGADIERWSTTTYVPNWRRALEDLDVLVATPQILFDMLCRGVLEAGIAAFDVLVFDEAHHCKGGHPFNKIMSLYRELDKSQPRPLVFGMSAAPAAGGGKATSSRVLTSLAQLQANMDARVVTVADRTELEAVVPQPRMEVVRFPPGSSYQKQQILKESIDRATERLQEAMAQVE
jgi:endoribonuclease Dicer